jgi:hypothetical protein
MLLGIVDFKVAGDRLRDAWQRYQYRHRGDYADDDKDELVQPCLCSLPRIKR